MMTTKTESGNSTSETFRLFPAMDDKTNPRSGFFNFSQPPSVPLPPCVEVLASEVSSSVKYTEESVSLGHLTLLKGRVNTKEVLGLSDSDLVPGKYEGGLKLWEGSLDLVKALSSETKTSDISFSGKRVLELGCGHGLPGLYSLLEDAAVVHFQDFNAEVLRCLTIPNVNANLSRKNTMLAKDQKKREIDSELRFFAGDWSEIDKLLPCAQNECKELRSASVHEQTGYDFILMAETVYSVDSLHTLYNLVKKCLSHPHGVVYMAGKKYYFGVGGGTRRFLSLVEKDGVLKSRLIAEVADGSSNVREIWKLSFKQD